LEKLAGEIIYWPVEVVLFDDDQGFRTWASESDAARQRAIYQRLKDKSLGTQSLEPLLKHADPKVRTLALTALFDRCDVKHLPVIAALVDDTAPTFDSRPTYAPEDRLQLKGMGLREPGQSVGRFAAQMVGEYIGPSGEKFADYWEKRRRRDFCTSWLRVRWMRAAQGTNRPNKTRTKQLQEVRRSIERLPADDATFVFLYLRANDKGAGLLSDAELVERCAAVGSEKLMLFLEGKAPTDGPPQVSQVNPVGDVRPIKSTGSGNATPCDGGRAARRRKSPRSPVVRHTLGVLPHRPS
jgi:hypothetical protein